MNVILFTTQLPSAVAEGLEQAGFRVFEALAVSEVLHLCEQEHIDMVVIAADVESPGVHDIQDKYITLRLTPQATIREVIAELWQLFPDKRITIQ